MNENEYKEPATVAEYRAAIDAMFPPTAPGAPNDCGVPLDALRIQGLLYAMAVRIEGLMTALRPFAMKAAVMANAKMCLQAQGRKDEPAGGIWVNSLNSMSLAAEEALFFDACDAFGRRAMEEIQEAAFKKVQQAAEAGVEKDKHVEEGKPVH